MNADCIPFDKLPHTSKLFQDHLSGKVKEFYPRSIRLGDWAAEEAANMRFDHDRRAAIAEILLKQNTGWNASPKTLENIARLKNGASAVVTGQQVALFGGPLFSIFKAITAIKLAEEAGKKGIECVPIFWLATEDHDFAEVNHANLLGKEKAALTRIDVHAGGIDGAPVSARPAATTVPQLTFGTSGGQINLGWPIDHTGWRLQVQTNSIGSALGADWITVPGSDATNQIFAPITNSQAFFRLVYP